MQVEKVSGWYTTMITLYQQLVLNCILISTYTNMWAYSTEMYQSFLFRSHLLDLRTGERSLFITHY